MTITEASMAARGLNAKWEKRSVMKYLFSARRRIRRCKARYLFHWWAATRRLFGNGAECSGGFSRKSSPTETLCTQFINWLSSRLTKKEIVSVHGRSEKSFKDGRENFPIGSGWITTSPSPNLTKKNGPTLFGEDGAFSLSTSLLDNHLNARAFDNFYQSQDVFIEHSDTAAGSVFTDGVRIIIAMNANG